MGDLVENTARIIRGASENTPQIVGVEASGEHHWQIRLRCVELALERGDDSKGKVTATAAAAALANFIIYGKPTA